MSTLTAEEIHDIQRLAKGGDDLARNLLWDSAFMEDVTAEQIRLVRAEYFEPTTETGLLIRDAMSDELIGYVVSPEMLPCEVLDAVERHVREHF